MNFKPIIGAAMLLTLSAPLHAIIIDHGDLRTNTDTNIIAEMDRIADPDTATGRFYSRFDTFNLSYTDVFNAVNGGIYNGWNIATEAIAYQFVDSALSGASACSAATATPPPSGFTCGSISGWNDGDFGASGGVGATQYDFFAYVADPTVLDPANLGLVSFDSTSGTAGIITDYNIWSASNGVPGSNSIGSGINLLLWTDDLVNANPLSSPVSAPEPGILALLSLGLLGMGARRFKAKG